MTTKQKQQPRFIVERLRSVLFRGRRPVKLPRPQWVRVGEIRASDSDAALKRAQEITGDSQDNLRVIGLAFGKEK